MRAWLPQRPGFRQMCTPAFRQVNSVSSVPGCFICHLQGQLKEPQGAAVALVEEANRDFAGSRSLAALHAGQHACYSRHTITHGLDALPAPSPCHRCDRHRRRQHWQCMVCRMDCTTFSEPQHYTTHSEQHKLGACFARSQVCSSTQHDLGGCCVVSAGIAGSGQMGVGIAQLCAIKVCHPRT